MVIEGGTVNLDATQDQRNHDRSLPTPFDFGPERVVWDRVFTDARMMALTDYLLAQPPALATRLRTQLFSELLPELGQMPLDELLTDSELLGERLDALIAKFANG